MSRQWLGYLDSFAAPVLTVNPRADMGVLAVGDEACGTIALVDTGGVRPLDLVIGDSSAWWNLNQ